MNPVRVLAVLVIAGLVLATLVAIANPRADIPVISQVVCGARGGSWYGGSIFAAAGCYQSPP